VVLTDWTIWRPENVLSLVVSNCGSDGVNASRVQVPASTATSMQQTSIATDFLVVSGGVIGINIARGLKKRYPTSKVTLIEKKASCGVHASGRNSGVLHAMAADPHSVSEQILMNPWAAIAAS
jgi:heterodisulfide reductase subunit A-like polyferredoxin